MFEDKKKVEEYSNPNWFVDFSKSQVSELVKDIRAKREDDEKKYIYYIIALCVASIGFTISKTFKEPLSASQVLLLISLFFWFLSINSGLKALRTHISKLYNDAEVNLIIGGIKTSETKEERKSKAQLLFADNDDFEKSLKKSFKFQGIYFLVGIGAYIAWRILEMALLNPAIKTTISQWLY